MIMIFNLANPFELDKYKEYVNALFKKKAVVEVKEKKKNRTIKQNAYLHVILSYFAAEHGISTEEVKLDIFKRTCNKDIFVRRKTNKYGKVVETVRSSASLNTAEMTTAIDRYRNWAASVAGIYLPSPQENDYLVHCQQVIEQNKEFVEQLDI